MAQIFGYDRPQDVEGFSRKSIPLFSSELRRTARQINMIRANPFYENILDSWFPSFLEGRAMPSYEASMRNLAKARKSPRWHPPRPWRSPDESEMVRRYAFWWFTCRDRNKPSGRDCARQLGISHTWLQRLVREFKQKHNADEMWRLQVELGDPTFEALSRARGYTKELKREGKVRPYRRRFI